jgi:hypothetical protein
VYDFYDVVKCILADMIVKAEELKDRALAYSLKSHYPLLLSP